MLRNGGTLIVSEQMYRQDAPPVAPGQRMKDSDANAKFDTFNCCHCDATVILRARMDPTHDGAILAAQPHWTSAGMGVCLMCKDGWSRGLICPSCHKIQNEKGGCRNYMRRLEAYEKRMRFRESLTE